MKILIQTDGASRGNPGPAAYGFVILKDGALFYEEGKTLGETTNNVAEYTALFQALAYLKSKVEAREVEELLIQADSLLMIKQLKGEYRIKNERLRPIFLEIRNFCQEYGRVSFEHIRREFNKRADRLGNMALDGLI